MPCLRCGDCCTFNGFSPYSVIQGFKNPGFASLVSFDRPELKPGIKEVSELSATDLSGAVSDVKSVGTIELFELEKELMTYLDEGACLSQVVLNDYGPLQSSVIRAKTLMDYFGTNHSYGTSRDHKCLFLKMGDEATCLIHPERLREERVRVSDPRGGLCPNYLCAKAKDIL